MKKIKALYLLPALLLSSCSNTNNIYGTYEFRLGKTDGTHIGVSATLKDEAYEQIEGMKKMDLKAEFGEEFSIAKTLDEYAEEYPIMENLLLAIKDEFAKIDTIPFYYSLTEYQNEKYGTRLNVGSDYLTTFFSNIFPDEVETIKENGFDLGPELLENIFSAYIGNKKLTFQIPVSLDDLKYQLCWYGFLIGGRNGLSSLDENKLPGDKGRARIGVHPKITKDEEGNITLDEVKEMNDNFAYEFSNTPLYIKNIDDSYTSVGAFYTKEENNKRILYFQYDSSYEGDKTVVDGYVRIKGESSNIFSVEKAIKFTLGENGIANVTHNAKTEKEEGFIDANNVEFTFREMMQDPYEFRNFHDVKVSLAKVQ